MKKLRQARAEVDALIDTAARGVRAIGSLTSTDAAGLAAQYDLAESEFRAFAQRLDADPPANVPAAIARDTAAAVLAMAEGVPAVKECALAGAQITNYGDTCTVAATTLLTRGTTAGEALRLKFGKYGTRSPTEIGELFSSS